MSSDFLYFGRLDDWRGRCDSVLFEDLNFLSIGGLALNLGFVCYFATFEAPSLALSAEERAPNRCMTAHEYVLVVL